MTEGLTTKERIAQVALDLFAMRGYRAVSIRDICKEVGIKESTVYYHYENKQAIWDALIDRMNELIKQKAASFDDAFKDVEAVSAQAMCEVAVGVLRNFFLQPFVYQVLFMLSIERMADEKANAEYQRIAFELPLKQQEKVFAQMMDKGIILKGDPQTLAAAYHGIIFLSYQKNCVGVPLTPEVIQRACEEIERPIADFYQRIRRG